MAYVRKTQTLIDNVEMKVISMMDSELEKLTKTQEQVDIGTPLHAEVKQSVEDALWQEAPDLKGKVPDSWVRTEASMAVSFRREGEVEAIRETIDFADNSRVVLPPSHGRWDGVEVPEKFMLPLVKDWVDGRKAVMVKQKETAERFEVIKTQLVGFLNLHASLNTAVKDMPELKLYLPDEYLARLDKKEVREKPNAKPSLTDDLNIDVDALTQAAIAHRITSGV